MNGGTCFDALNSLSCQCRPGYSGLFCQTDINECSSLPCRNLGTCVDRVNGFTCTCVAGFSGLQCQTDINECASLPCTNGGLCVDNVNGYTCTTAQCVIFDCRVFVADSLLFLVCQVNALRDGVVTTVRHNCLRVRVFRAEMAVSAMNSIRFSHARVSPVTRVCCVRPTSMNVHPIRVYWVHRASIR